MTPSLISEFSDRLRSDGPTPELQAEIQRAVVARRGQPGEHCQWAILCEQAGLLSLAFSEFQLALRDDPDDPVAAFHLAQHYRERGDIRRALALLERLLAREPARRPWLDLFVEILVEDRAGPRAQQAIALAQQHGLPDADAAALLAAFNKSDDTAPPRSQPPALDLVPTDADCVRFCTLFAGQEGVYARQWVGRDGQTGYSPVREPLTPSVVRNHLLGSFTVGVYLLRLDNTAAFFALDLDIDRSALQQAQGDHSFAQSLRDSLRAEGPRLLQALRQLGFQPLFENSGYKGRHFWVFLEQPESAETLHLLGRLFLAWQSPQLPAGFHLEFFPKQPRLKGKSLGNLIKLPLGIHRQTGRRSQFLDDQGQPLPHQLAALQNVALLPNSALYAAIEQLKTLVPAGSLETQVSPPWEGSPQTESPPVAPQPTPGPPPPPPAPQWTEADFQTDPRVRHLLEHCPVLAALKQQVDECQRLSHEEQLVLIHSLGHLEGGPQAVNYLLDKCIDVGPEKHMKARLKGSPISCPSIRKKIPHVTRRVACNCAFEFASDRYPTPVLHLLTLPPDKALPQAAPAEPSLVQLAQRYAAIERRRAEILAECEQLRQALVQALRTLPDRSLPCPGGSYRLISKEGVEELLWQPDTQSPNSPCTP